VDGSGDADSLLWFRLKRRVDGMKRCRKMKWKQRAGLASMEGSMTQRTGMMTLTREEAAPGKRKE
jgi:hypothetical protein